MMLLGLSPLFFYHHERFDPTITNYHCDFASLDDAMPLCSYHFLSNIKNVNTYCTVYAKDPGLDEICPRQRLQLECTWLAVFCGVIARQPAQIRTVPKISSAHQTSQGAVTEKETREEKKTKYLASSV